MYRLARLRAPALSPRLLRTHATSSPKSAERASSQSGGARSIDANEHQSPPDAFHASDARGRTGGGPPLEASRAAPARPKVYNASVNGGTASLTEEQKAEVARHNAEFEEKHGRAPRAEGDKVDKSFWAGTGEIKGPREKDGGKGKGE